MNELIAPVLLILAITVFFYLRRNLTSDVAKENIRISNEFLKINKNRSGVQETKTGLQYLVLSKGQGNIHPTAKDSVNIRYCGKLLDDTIFDSSVDIGLFDLKNVIDGWQEGLQLMVVGEKIQLFIPPNLAYGSQPYKKITAGSLLIVEIELLGIGSNIHK